MPVFRNRAVLEISRSVKAFVNLEAGITRGKIPAVAQAKPKNERTISHPAKSAPPKSVVGGSPSKFFLIGNAKSGTSWLMGLLHSHPEIFCRGEGKLFGKDSPRTLHGALARSELLATWLDRNPWTWRANDPNLDDIMGVLVDYLMTEKLSKTNKKIVGDKTPIMSTETVKEISEICPGSKVIHIIRDGRDVAVSTAHHTWNNAEDQGGPIPLSPERTAKRDAYRANPASFGAEKESIFVPGQVAEMAQEWKTHVSRAAQDGHNLLGSNYHQIRYEDLLVEPVAQARQVLSFLGADSSEEVTKKCVEAVSFEKKASRKPGEEDPTSFYRKGVSGDWKGVFTREDRQTFKEEAGNLLIELGYEKDDEW